MSDQVYIRPIGFAPGPQSEEGDANHFGGGSAYASGAAVNLGSDCRSVKRGACAVPGVFIGGDMYGNACSERIRHAGRDHPSLFGLVGTAA